MNGWMDIANNDDYTTTTTTTTTTLLLLRVELVDVKYQTNNYLFVYRTQIR
jgi:hypothetical protein